MSAWREFWSEVSQPSDRSETAYQWASIACGHVVVGMTAAAVSGWLGRADAAWMLAPLYFAVKELRDIMRGGSELDSLVDTAFFALGLVLASVPQASPLVAAAIAAGITLRRPRMPAADP